MANKILMSVAAALAGAILTIGSYHLYQYIRADAVEHDTMELICAPGEVAFAYAQKEYKEKPIIITYDPTNDYTLTLLVNGETQSWTLIRLKEKIGCIVASGTGIIDPAEVLKGSKTQKSL
jgi:hypothetical protein